MPQMAPLMWLTIFTVFSSLLLLNYILIYSKKFIPNPKILNEINSINYKNFNWK
uniref:ATP synthase complex subunit 8 n=1 Tax=Paranurophorus simplex TaxID=2583953 RepID=A0A6H0EW56_9HEXA|nr:ATP synthase F0 subunit 8 [Paranurophorus simplex]